MIGPSWFSIFKTELTATMLLIQTILPIAPSTDCNANTKVVEMPVISAVDNCTLPKVKLDTVFEPEKNAPTAH